MRRKTHVHSKELPMTRKFLFAALAATADLMATNGVIHATDAVSMPN